MTTKALNRLILVVVALIVFFVVVWPLATGYFIARGINVNLDPRNIASTMRNAGADLAASGPEATATPSRPAEEIRPASTEVMTGTLPRLSAEALGILAEVDEAVKVQDKTPAYRDFRFGVSDLGQRVAAAMVFNTDGAIKMRVSCDDECTAFYLVTQDGEVTALTPGASYGPKYDYQTLDADALKMAADMGINTTDSEILAQHLFYTEISVKPGDQIVVDGNDDPELGVNRGVFTSWTWSR